MTATEAKLILARRAIESLPDSIEGRKLVLQAVVISLSSANPLRLQAAYVLRLLEAHEKAQLELRLSYSTATRRTES